MKRTRLRRQPSSSTSSFMFTALARLRTTLAIFSFLYYIYGSSSGRISSPLVFGFSEGVAFGLSPPSSLSIVGQNRYCRDSLHLYHGGRRRRRTKRRGPSPTSSSLVHQVGFQDVGGGDKSDNEHGGCENCSSEGSVPRNSQCRHLGRRSGARPPTPRGDAPTSLASTTTTTRRDAIRITSETTVLAWVAATRQPHPTWAGVPELDERSGQLYSPKIQMLSGRGSDAARGLIPERRDSDGTSAGGGGVARTSRLVPGQAVQTVYETRFVAYLSRFLLNYDPAAHAWWINRGVGDTWDSPAATKTTVSTAKISQTSSRSSSSSSSSDDAAALAAENAFAEFCESVEIGLSDYFVGPYGSYSSLDAMTAGLLASAPAKSQRPGGGRMYPSTVTKKSSLAYQSLTKQGILNLYTLLKARYTSVSAKRQLAVLFSFVSNPALQPTQEISALLGEADNATVSRIELVPDREGSVVGTGLLTDKIDDGEYNAYESVDVDEQEEEGKDVRRRNPVMVKRRRSTIRMRRVVADESSSRTSPRRGGGYSLDDVPTVMIDPPPALGDAYPCALARPIMKPTGRVFKIQLLDGGTGYGEEAPIVRVTQGGIRRACQAVAILDRNGHVESIIVLDPGYGYGGVGSGQVRNLNKPPAVHVDPPPKNLATGGGIGASRPAKAAAVLEYEITGIELLRGGAGYVKSEPPAVRVSPPREDPDWFLSVQEQPELRMIPVESDEDIFSGIRARVTEMRQPDGNIAYSLSGSGAAPPSAVAMQQPQIDDALLDRLHRDPLELLPQWVRPQRRPVVADVPQTPTTKSLIGATSITERASGLSRTAYTIPVLDSIPQVVAVLNPRYRAYDPVFGGVGKVPVTKGALELRFDEYARLALSGAVCTVVVRTLLNPLELVKTKQQLKNDPELLNYVMNKKEALQLTAVDIFTATSNEAVTKIVPLVRVNSTFQALAVDESTTTLAQVAEVTNVTEAAPVTVSVGTVDMLRGIIELRGPLALFQSADITFLASLAFGSFGFGATELFRRSFTAVFFTGDATDTGGSEFILLIAAALATVLTAAVAAPFELLRVRSMGLLEPTKWTEVLQEFLNSMSKRSVASKNLDLKSLKPRDVLPLWSGFAPTLSRELPFAIAKFLTFDLLAHTMVAYFNAQTADGALPIQVGVGPLGLAISAASGAVAGIAGAIVSHPADLILTKTSARRRSSEAAGEPDDWKEIVKEMMSQDGGIANLFVGLGARSTFFFLVIGLQFFLYDYVKNLFQVGSDDLSLVLDVFYAVRAGLSTVQS